MPRAPRTQKHNLEEELDSTLSRIAQQRHEQTGKELADTLGLSFSSLSGVPIDPEALQIVPEGVARDAKCAVIHKEKTVLTVAVLDPRTPQTKDLLDSLKKRGFSCTLIVTTLAALQGVWSRYDTLRMPETIETGAIEINEEHITQLQQKLRTLNDLNAATQSTTTTLLEVLIAGALAMHASDVHLEAEKGAYRTRYRIDGLLEDAVQLDLHAGQKIIDRLKVLARLKLNVKHAPQDGRFTIHQRDVAIEVRVSALPGEYGETIVMRLLDPRTIRTTLEDLGMRQEVLNLILTRITTPTGAILTTGPTGSGKTTTLYALVNRLNNPERKIITIEDPIEYHIAGISQTQTDPQKGYSFASGLRAIVRQDPDIILVGEIRDLETAEIALHASLTGHLVLSTLHTNDAAGTIPRLLDLGAKPEAVAPALSLTMGQRLVRRLCSECKKEVALSESQRAQLTEAFVSLPKEITAPTISENTRIYKSVGCDTCNGLGYRGRIGVYEAFGASPELETLILERPATSTIRTFAIKNGMTTMIHDGYFKVLEGITSLEEVRRVLGQ